MTQLQIRRPTRPKDTVLVDRRTPAGRSLPF